MARKKLHREPVLKDWAEVNDALRSIHEYEHALTEMGVDMSRRIDAVKAEFPAGWDISCAAGDKDSVRRGIRSGRWLHYRSERSRTNY